MEILANAKINLYLNVTGKREDGYHLLDMVMLEIPFGDKITVEKSDKINITANGWLPKENTLKKACDLFFDYTKIKGGADIFIKKSVPSGAGMGGGSSDGAAVLKALNEIYGANLSADELKKLGLKIGADVPFFIEGGCARATGIGENLQQIKSGIKGFFVLAKPFRGVSTPKAYNICDSLGGNLCNGDKAVELIKKGDTKSLGKICVNMLENAAIKICPEIKIIKDNFYDSEFSLMTGSGSCVFGYYESRKKAIRAKKRLDETDEVFFSKITQL